jgi:hypothetical protein
VIAAAPTSAQTKCASTNYNLKRRILQHQDAQISFTMLHTWDVTRTETRIGHSLTR